MDPTVLDPGRVLSPHILSFTKRVKGPAILVLQRVKVLRGFYVLFFQYNKIQHTILYFDKWTMSSALFFFIWEPQEST